VPYSAQGVAIGRGKEQERSISSNISSDSPFSSSKYSKSSNDSWKSKGVEAETTATSFLSDGGDGSESSFEGTKNRELDDVLEADEDSDDVFDFTPH